MFSSIFPFLSRGSKGDLGENESEPPASNSNNNKKKASRKTEKRKDNKQDSKKDSKKEHAKETKKDAKVKKQAPQAKADRATPPSLPGQVLPPEQCIELRVKANGSPPHEEIIRVPKNHRVRLSVPPGHFDLSTVTVKTNLPPEGKRFQRGVYYDLHGQDYLHDGCDGAWIAEFTTLCAGAFALYVEGKALGPSVETNAIVSPTEGWDCESTRMLNGRDIDTKLPQGMTRSPLIRFVVDPLLPGVDDTAKYAETPLHGVCQLTMLTKLMGPLDSWSDVLRLPSALGYNMIHLTPVQELGESQSCYSINDHNKLAPRLFSNLSMPEGKGECESTINEKRLEMLEQTLSALKQSHNMLFMTDIVLNHTANSTPWLKDHPEATYSLLSCPYLIPAFEVDEAVRVVSNLVAEGKAIAEDGHQIPCKIDSTDVINKIVARIEEEVAKKKVYEYYQFHETDTVNVIVQALVSTAEDDMSADKYMTEHVVMDNAAFNALSPEAKLLFAARKTETSRGRFPNAVEATLVKSVFGCLKNEHKNEEDMATFVRNFVREANHFLKLLCEDDVRTGIQSIRGTAAYEWLDKHTKAGKGSLGLGEFLVPTYFTRTIAADSTSVDLMSRLDSGDPVAFANNGFIWGGNPLIDFAAPGSFPSCSSPYLRRELVIWGDCVKLRYGERKEDSPWLWSYMKRYIQTMAKLFHGIRIDNAHGTPLHVAAAMLDAAREIRPDLYVVAELFTGSEQLDVKYTAILGITALIREAMQAQDVKELSHMIHIHSGRPVGSLLSRDEADKECHPGILPAVFFDCTHDNDTPTMKRTTADALSTAALVAVTAAGIGSVWGFDLLLPRRLSVVTEGRPYWTAKPEDIAILMSNGICQVKKKLNDIHKTLSRQGFTEVFSFHGRAIGCDELLTVTRAHPDTHESVVMVCRTAFHAGGADLRLREPVRIEGRVDKVLLASSITITQEQCVEDPEKLQGVESSLNFSEDSLLDLARLEELESEGVTLIHLDKELFVPGSVLALKVHPFHPEHCKTDVPPEDMDQLKKLVTDTGDARSSINLGDLSTLLFSGDAEELDVSKGKRGAYVVPNYGALPYCGLAGPYGVMRKVQRDNNLGHPIAENLRQGLWLPHYLVNRLDDDDRLHGVRDWLKSQFSRLEKMPPGLRPQAFWRILDASMSIITQAALTRLSSCILTGSEFVRKLALTSFIVMREIPSAPLLDYKTAPYACSASMAAGLPHFSTGFMRCWGRDTFISLRGILLVTGRFEEAKSIILAFASVLRHGLIPNLMDGGRHPRYNARDATWWFLQAVQDYTRMAPNGPKLLQETVYRLFSSDDEHAEQKPFEQPLHAVILEILEKHYNGIDFREWNAGPSIDSHMKDEGFQVQAFVDHDTGFVRGGSEFNCGTWMDKMGESKKASTDGVPATPRDGADVEINGLLASTLNWLQRLHETKDFPHAGIPLRTDSEADASTTLITWGKWLSVLKENFEKIFYIPATAAEDANYILNESLINNRGIYKDTVGASSEFCDYQLRPNQVVAMAVAPFLFTPRLARIALDNVDHTLWGTNQLGLKTLSPDDWAYRGDYDNANDSSDPAVAKGFNYHQGPEWLWPYGYFLRARMNFIDTEGLSSEDISKAKKRLFFASIINQKKFIEEDVHMALPELTNHAGSFCPFSCTAQAWSMATLLDAYWDACGAV